MNTFLSAISNKDNPIAISENFCVAYGFLRKDLIKIHLDTNEVKMDCEKFNSMFVSNCSCKKDHKYYVLSNTVSFENDQAINLNLNKKIVLCSIENQKIEIETADQETKVSLELSNLSTKELFSFPSLDTLAIYNKMMKMKHFF